MSHHDGTGLWALGFGLGGLGFWALSVGRTGVPGIGGPKTRFERVPFSSKQLLCCTGRTWTESKNMRSIVVLAAPASMKFRPRDATAKGTQPMEKPGFRSFRDHPI